MAIIRKRAAGRNQRGASRTRAGLGGRGAAQKGLERALETEVIDETQDLDQPDRAGKPQDRARGRTGGAHRAGKHAVEDGSLAQERGGVMDPRVSGAIRPQRSAPKRRSR